MIDDSVQDIKKKVSSFHRDFRLSSLKKDYWFCVAATAVSVTFGVWIFTKSFDLGLMAGISILSAIGAICNFIKIQIKFPDRD